MAYIISKQDKKGHTWAQSYWRPERITVNKTDKTASVLFVGYRDSTKVDFIGSHGYNVTDPAQFDARFGSGATLPPLEAAYALAQATKDVPNPAAPKDASQNTGFFDGAQDV